LAEIERLADAGRWGAVAHAAHKLRGSAGVYGFAALAVAAGELEDALTVAEGAAAEPPQVALRGLREQLALAIRELP
jgi:HPt (histidine-containing phosphotransfer) domain-containing protein